MGEEPSTTPPLPLPKRVVMAFASPGALGEHLARRPQWAGALVLCVILATTMTSVLYFSPAGKAMMMAEFRKAAQQSGQPLDMFEEMYPVMAGFGVVSAVVVTPVMMLIIAGVLWIVLTAIMGAETGFLIAGVRIGVRTMFVAATQ